MIQYRVFICLIVLLMSLASANAKAVTPHKVEGVLFPDEMGAKGNGVHDDTSIIQLAIDSLVNKGGGTVWLGSGTYLVTSIKLGPKVSLIGNGNGATLIKQKKGERQSCLVIRNIAGALKIADLTVLGEDVNSGVYFEESGGLGENHKFLYTNTSKWDLSQAYKWITIDNVCVYHFENGLEIERWGFNINICNSTFSHNGNGVIMRCTDSSIYNCYITNNKKDGLNIAGSNNRISNIKSIFNGAKNPKGSSAIVVYSSRCQLINCETQDNYCKGFAIMGQYNILSNCISNTDGYNKEPKGYDLSIEACGFRVCGLYNSFTNCAVTNYNEKYGAVYYSPVIVDEAVAYYYPNIFEGIKVLIAKDKLMFHEPFRNIQTLNTKNRIGSVLIEGTGANCYFVSAQNKNNVIKNLSCQMNSLNMLVDFKCIGETGKLVTIGDGSLFCLGAEKKEIWLKMGKQILGLSLDDDAVLNEDDIRLIVSFSYQSGKRMVSLLCYEKTTKRGWIKKEIRQEMNNDVQLMLKNADLKVGDTNVFVKRLAVTNSPLPESVFLPYSNTNCIYDAAFVYVDADSYMR